MIARSQLTLLAVTAMSLSAQSNTATILGNVTIVPEPRFPE
jgi:hypothetical protein